MDKVAQISMLIDFYGGLLTPKQYTIVDMYYNNDYSLSEIAENLGISRQGVHDSLKRAENILFSYEDKLGLVNKFILQKNLIKKVLDNLKSIDISQINGKSSESISQSINILENMLSEEL